MKERATFVKDIWDEGSYFFVAPEKYDEDTVKKKWKPETNELVAEWKTVILALEDFSPAAIEMVFKDFLTAKNLGMGAMLPNFRLAVTGQGTGPSMFEISAVLGKDEVVKRLEKAVGLIS
jgi:glutamyl-tRNA synthetase